MINLSGQLNPTNGTIHGHNTCYTTTKIHSTSCYNSGKPSHKYYYYRFLPRNLENGFGDPKLIQKNPRTNGDGPKNTRVPRNKWCIYFLGTPLNI